MKKMSYIIDKSILITAFEHRYNRKPSTLELHAMNDYLHKHTDPIYTILNDALVEIEISMKKK